MKIEPKNILIYGAGVIGSVYGGLLAKSGNKVTLLARNKRFETLKSEGLKLKRVNSPDAESVEVEVISEVSESAQQFDFVFVTLRYEQVQSALAELKNIPTTCFVFMVNNPSGYDEWIKVLGRNRVLPAFPGAGGKIENGIVHYEIVSKMVQPTTLAELSGERTARLKELTLLLKKAGFYVAVTPDMDVWQKTHIAMVAPMGDVIYFDEGNNYTVAKNKQAIIQMNLALKENFRFLKVSGIGIQPSKLRIFLLLPMPILNYVMKLVFNTKWAETVICNHALNARSEMEVITDDFVKMAESKGYTIKELPKLLRK